MFRETTAYIDKLVKEKKLPLLDVRAYKNHECLYKHCGSYEGNFGDRELLSMFSCTKVLTAVSGMKLLEPATDGKVLKISDDYLSQKTIDLVDKLSAWFDQGDTYINPPGGSLKNDLVFADGRALFTQNRVYIADATYGGGKLRHADWEYGILPNPTYEEGTDYNSVVYFFNTVHLWAIPTKVNNSEIAQQMMNIFAAYSNSEFEDSTMYAYYTRTLYFTTAPDEGSRDVMDLIKSSMVYDIALLYDWDKMASITLFEMTTSARGLYANNVTNQDGIRKELEKTVEQLQNPQMIK